jgi:hypothetical protein
MKITARIRVPRAALETRITGNGQMARRRTRWLSHAVENTENRRNELKINQ